MRAWLVTTAKREALAILEQQRRRAEQSSETEDSDGEHNLLEQLPDPSPLADEQLVLLQQHELLRRAVDQLDPRSRQFVEWAFLQDEPLSHSELAAKLGMAEGSVGPTRQRCLEKLRRLLAAC